MIRLLVLTLLFSGCALHQTIHLHVDGSCEIEIWGRLGDGSAACGLGTKVDPTTPTGSDSSAQPGPVPDQGQPPLGAPVPLAAPQTTVSGFWAEEHGANMSTSAAGVFGGLVGALTACITTGACW